MSCSYPFSVQKEHQTSERYSLHSYIITYTQVTKRCWCIFTNCHFNVTISSAKAILCWNIHIHPSCWMKGLDIASIPSAGHINTTEVPLHTTKPSCLVSSVSLYGSSGSKSKKYSFILKKHFTKCFIQINLNRIK